MPDINHVIIPNDDPLTRRAQCAFCKRAADGAVQVQDPNKLGKQTFIMACAKHKLKAIAKASSVLRKYYKKRVIVDIPEGPIERMGGTDTMLRPGDKGVVNK